jgi:hypothetical protein
MKLTTLLVCAMLLVPAGTLFSQPPQKDSAQAVGYTRRVLEGAYGDLEKAGDEWGGHRVKAMEHIKAAIAELDEADKWAKAHHDIK